MFYVLCPNCGAVVEVPANAVGPKRTDLYNVTWCDQCGVSFDYDDDDVQRVMSPSDESQ